MGSWCRVRSVSSACGRDVCWVDLDRRCPCLLGPDWCAGTASWQKGAPPFSHTHWGACMFTRSCLWEGREVLSLLRSLGLAGLSGAAERPSVGCRQAFQKQVGHLRKPPEQLTGLLPSSPRKPPQAPRGQWACSSPAKRTGQEEGGTAAPGRELPLPVPPVPSRQPAWPMSPGTEKIQCQKQGSDSVGVSQRPFRLNSVYEVSTPWWQTRQRQEDGRAAGLSRHRCKTLKKIRRTGVGSE